MKQKSIKVNYLYNLVLNILRLIFPLISFPYVSRVLGPEYLGKVNFARAFIDYFEFAARLGIMAYGMKEIAKVRDDKEKLNKTFSELFVIIVFSSIVSLFLYISVIFFMGSGNKLDIKLLYIFGIKIIFMAMYIDWFFKGLEDYKYITLRSTGIKLLSIGLMLLIIKKESDYTKYAGIMVFAFCSENIINFISSFKYIKPRFRELNFKQHIKPLLLTALMVYIGRIYSGLDKLMLGFMSGDSYVGYYSAPVRMLNIIDSIIMTLSTVLIPRMSYYLEKKDFKRFNSLFNDSINFILFISIPIVIGINFLAKDTVLIFSGEKYLNSVLTLKILSVFLVLNGIRAVISSQLMYIKNKNKEIIVILIISSFFGLIANIILIPVFRHNGAAFATVLASFIAVVFQYFYTRKNMNEAILNINTLKILIGAFFLYLFLIIIHNLQINNIVYRLCINITGSIIIYGASCYLLKEKMTLYILNTVLKNKFNK